MNNTCVDGCKYGGFEFVPKLVNETLDLLYRLAGLLT